MVSLLQRSDGHRCPFDTMRQIPCKVQVAKWKRFSTWQVLGMLDHNEPPPVGTPDDDAFDTSTLLPLVFLGLDLLADCHTSAVPQHGRLWGSEPNLAPSFLHVSFWQS